MNAKVELSETNPDVITIKVDRELYRKLIDMEINHIWVGRNNIKMDEGFIGEFRIK